MKLPSTGYVVLMHHQEIGTWSPCFPSMDQAEEFSNAMRLVNSELAVSEPIPLVQTVTYKVTEASV
jgi:hypothetical protein